MALGIGFRLGQQVRDLASRSRAASLLARLGNLGEQGLLRRRRRLARLARGRGVEERGNPAHGRGTDGVVETGAHRSVGGKPTEETEPDPGADFEGHRGPRKRAKRGRSFHLGEGLHRIRDLVPGRGPEAELVSDPCLA